MALQPGTGADVADAIADAIRKGRKLAIRGGGTHRDFGASHDAAVLETHGFARIIDYDPAELVLTVGAGTPLAEILHLLDGAGQMLAFEPFDAAPHFARTAGAATIGGVIAAAVSGPRRLSAGAARDHLLGFEAVSGRGEVFKAGGRVVKNVTGYDLAKLMTGSRGRLAVLTQLSLRTMPRGRVCETLALPGLDAAATVAAMARAMGSTAGVAAAAHLPMDGGMTMLRLEGFAPSIAARRAILHACLADFGLLEPLAPEAAADRWQAVRDVVPLADCPILWRVQVPPSAAVALLAGLGPAVRWLIDWAGGLLWVGADRADPAIRRLSERAGGHATLVRAPVDVRAGLSALHPLVPALAALEQRVRRAFDPEGVFETGQFLEI